jgi:hypothetical protein
VENQILVDPNNDSSTFQELYELAQRKFLRQLVKFSESDQFKVFPRLLIMDMIERQKMEEVKEERNEEKINDIKLSRNATILKNTKSDFISGFSVLCENEEGWHKTSYFLPVDESLSLSNWHPYLARVLSLLKK